MRARLVLTLALGAGLGSAGCAGHESSGGAGGSGGSCDPGGTVRLEVTPASIARGEAALLTVRWELEHTVSAPRVTMTASAVEVEVPLQEHLSAWHYVYRAQLLNPFGSGAPAGTVDVLAQAQPPQGCFNGPTASTSFDLD